MQKKIIYYSILVFLLVSCIIFVEYATAQSPTNNNIDISGIYISDKHAFYHVKQINNTVWILGTQSSDDDALDTVSNIFSGILDSESNRISGKWIVSPLSNNIKSGNIQFDLLADNSKKKYNHKCDSSYNRIK
jgi:hypothetical protein